MKVRHSSLPVSASIGRNKTAHAELAAGHAHHHPAVDHQRGERHVVALPVVLDLRGPDLLAGLRIERHQDGFGRRKEHLVAVQADAAVGRMQLRHVLGDRPLVAPQNAPGLGVDRQELVARGRDEHHAVVDHRRRLMAFDLAGGEAPDRLQAADILRRDLGERAVAPAVVGAPEQQPVAVFGFLSRARVTPV